MTGAEFLRKVKRWALAQKLSYHWMTSRGKGSHGMLFVGLKRTLVKDLKKEIGPGLLKSMCNALGIDAKDL